MLQLMIDAETGMRGYSATDKVIFLDPYSAALPHINTDVQDLHGLVLDNRDQLIRVDSLSLLVASQLGIIKENIAVRDTRGLDYMITKTICF